MHRVLCLFRIFIFGCVLLQCDAYESPEEFTIHVIDALTPDTIPQDPTISDFLFAAYNCGFQMALDMFKNNTCNFPPLLPNTKLTLDNRADFNVSPNTIKHVIDIAERGSSLIIGLPNGETAGSAAVTGEVYDIAILSAFSPSSFLDDAEEYPYFTRVPSGTRREVETLLDSLLYYFHRSGPGWTDIAIITSIDGIGIDFSNQLVLQAPEKGIHVFGYQQFLPSAQSYFIELRELSNSGARVIVASVLGNFSALLEQANEFGIVGDHYVWAVASHTGAVSFSPPYDLYRGILTTRQYYLPDSVYAECFTNSRAAAADQYICGAPEFEFLNTGPFENILTTIYALDSLDQRELLDKRVSAKSWSETIRNLSFDGLTGHVSFDKNGQRQGVVELSYFNPETESFVVALLGYPNGSIEELEKVVWFSNTTEIPDLDIRPPFSYWSCEDGEERRDETGKTVNLHSPDGEDVDEIESAYHCDLFIDCKNLSDESKDCPTNYTTLFIIFGIITGLLMCVAVFLILFVIIFGVGLKYQKVKKRSPNFLIILLVSIFIGYSSVFAFYGKPHPVACAFQPWLLGLPAISMIAVLTVKNFRVYRIFRFPLKRIKVSDVEVFVLWVCVMVPAVIIIIIWSIVSTPTARLEERDGNDHYVCTTGGFTDTPGGIIFFCIFVAYSAVVLLIGAVISFLARNIPSSFNETKLLTISIYNLGFLAAVIIPVLLVVQPFNPFIAWILRTVAVLYAFTATMLLQFSSMLFNIVIVDRMKNKTNTVVFGSSTSLTPGG